MQDSGRLAADYPGFTVRTTVAWGPALLEGLCCGEQDILVCDTRFVTNRDELNIISLPKYFACFVCRTGHPLTGKQEVTFRDILNYPVATTRLPGPITQALARLSGLRFRSLDELPNGLIEAPCHLLTQAIVCSDAVGLGIPSIFQEKIDGGILHLLPLQSLELTTHYELISLKCYTLPPAVELFQKYIINTCQELTVDKK